MLTVVLRSQVEGPKLQFAMGLPAAGHRGNSETNSVAIEPTVEG